jgi:hypothetical protein
MFPEEAETNARLFSKSEIGTEAESSRGRLRQQHRRLSRLLLLALVFVVVGLVAWSELRYAVFRYVVQGGYPDDQTPTVAGNPRYRIQQSLQRQLSNFCVFLSRNYDRCQGDFDCYAKLLPRKRRVWYRGRKRPVFERPLPGLGTADLDRIDRTHCMTSNNELALTTAQLERVRQARNCSAPSRYLWFVYVVRNEARLVVQNILHHLAQGVEHFLVYDNESSDNLVESLEPFQKLGLVSLYRISGQGVQLRAYDDALRKARDAGVFWLGAIDADEFFISTRAVCIPALLEQVFRDHNKTMAALGLNWQLPGRYAFMMNGTSFPAENVAFAVGVPNRHIKSIVYVPRTKQFVLPHNAEYYSPGVGRSVSGRIPNGPFLEPPDVRDAVLVHFLYKSATDWMQKRIRGRADISWSVMKTQPQVFFNDDIISFFMEWLEQRKAAPFRARPLERALQNHTLALKQALWN